MFDTINNPPKNEHDVKLAEIELEKIKEITKQLPEYNNLCSEYLIPSDGGVVIKLCGTTVEIQRYHNDSEIL